VSISKETVGNNTSTQGFQVLLVKFNTKMMMLEDKVKRMDFNHY
jgi:hypothetical protein